MSDLGITHLAGRQTNSFSVRDERGVRVLIQELQVGWCSSQDYRVVLRCCAQTPPVEDDQHDG